MSFDIVTFVDDDDRLAFRHKHLSASRIPILLGAGYDSSPFSLWVEMTSERETQEESEKMRLRFAAGHALEELGLQELSRKLEKKVGRCKATFKSHELPWLTATPDGLVEGDPKEGAECKTIAFDPRGEWDDGPGLYAYIQSQACMLVTGGQRHWVAGIFGLGKEVRTFEVQRNSDVIEVIRDRGERFWQFVENNEPPSSDFIDASAATARALKKHFHNVEQGTEVDLERHPGLGVAMSDYMRAKEQLAELKPQVRVLEEVMSETRHKVLHAMGACERAILPGGIVFKRSRVNRKAQKATSYVQIREVKQKR